MRWRTGDICNHNVTRQVNQKTIQKVKMMAQDDLAARSNRNGDARKGTGSTGFMTHSGCPIAFNLQCPV
jgi:aspartyl/asparaginyl beta-hydroxylase (cupin superfamily)